MRDNGIDRLQRARELAASAGALSTLATLDLQLAAPAWLALDVPDLLAAATRCADVARRWHLDLVLTEALMFTASAHAVADRRAEMERTIADADAAGGSNPEVEIVARTRRGMFALMRAERATATAAYDEAVAIARSSPTVYVRTSWNTSALLRTVDGPGGAEVRSRNPLASRLIEAIVRYCDAIDAGGGSARRGRGTRRVRPSAAGPPPLRPQRHLAERQVAECALVDGWGDPVAWLHGCAAYFGDHGHAHVERACRSLLRRAGAPLPRRGDGVPPELAALGVTEREAEVLALVADGLTSKEVATRLFLSVRTVDKHVERLPAKTGCSRRTQLRAFRT